MMIISAKVKRGSELLLKLVGISFSFSEQRLEEVFGNIRRVIQMKVGQPSCIAVVPPPPLQSGREQPCCYGYITITLTNNLYIVCKKSLTLV
jgi:hypothetical protein